VAEGRICFPGERTESEELSLRGLWQRHSGKDRGLFSIIEVTAMKQKTLMVSLFRACFKKPFHFSRPQKKKANRLAPNDRGHFDLYRLDTKADWPGSLPDSD